MPIIVTCPGCPTKLSAPDTAAGKQIRCPKCGAVATVPVFVPSEEVPVVEAAVAPPKPKPKPATVEPTITCCVVCNSMIAVLGKIKDGLVHCPNCGFANPVRNRLGESEKNPEDKRPPKKARRDEDDKNERPRKKKRARDEDEYDHDQPRKKKRKAAGGGKGGIIAVIVIGGLFLLCGGGFGIYLLVGKSSPFAKKTPVPAGWKQHTYSNDGFRAYFPKEPQMITMGGGFPMGMGGMGGGFPGANAAVDIESVSSYTSGDHTDSFHVTVTIARFRGQVPAALRDPIRNLNTGQPGGFETRKVRWLGYDAGELVMGGTLMRIVYTDRLMITVQLTGPKGARTRAEEEAAFFDNFELTK